MLGGMLAARRAALLGLGEVTMGTVGWPAQLAEERR
jgi:hypothetical protein